MKTSRSLKIAAAIAVSALALTGINATAASAADSKKIYTLGGTDPFFAVVKNGFDSAADTVKAGGSTATWLAIKDWSNAGPDMNKITQTAVNAGADAIATPIWGAAAQVPALQAVVKKGIPVVLYNTGIELVKKVGALGYVGADDYVAGKAAGAAFAKAGIKHVLCLNGQPGAINTAARCKGTKDAMVAAKGKSTELALPATKFGDATAIAAAVKGALTKDKTIDGVLGLAQAFADASVTSIKAIGSKAKVGAFDISTNGLANVKAGSQLFCVDQQGWLQGFMSTTIAWQYAAYGLLPATTTILTGPALVTKSNVDLVSAGVKTGQR